MSARENALPELARFLGRAIDTLKAANDAAAKERESRDRAALLAMLRRYGACNTVSMLSDACYDIHSDTDIEDWNTAGTLLGDAANAVNLKYDADGCDNSKLDAARAAIKAGRGTPGDYAVMREHMAGRS